MIDYTGISVLKTTFQSIVLMITCKSPTILGKNQQTTSTLLQARQKSKSKVGQGIVSTVHFVVAMENETNPCYQIFHI